MGLPGDRYADLDDATLLERTDDEPQAFGEFYRRHAEMILGYFYRRTACPQVAADLTAETFAAALSSASRYRRTGAPASAWLVGIARNQLRYYHRQERASDKARRKLGIQRIRLDDRSLERVVELADLDDWRADLAEAWDELSRNVADAVRLRVLEELPYREIASELGCSEGAARVRVSRGLSELSDQLEGADG